MRPIAPSPRDPTTIARAPSFRASARIPGTGGAAVTMTSAPRPSSPQPALRTLGLGPRHVDERFPHGGGRLGEHGSPPGDDPVSRALARPRKCDGGLGGGTRRRAAVGCDEYREPALGHGSPRSLGCRPRRVYPRRGPGGGASSRRRRRRLLVPRAVVYRRHASRGEIEPAGAGERPDGDRSGAEGARERADRASQGRDRGDQRAHHAAPRGGLPRGADRRVRRQLFRQDGARLPGGARADRRQGAPPGPVGRAPPSRSSGSSTPSSSRSTPSRTRSRTPRTRAATTPRWRR